MMRCLESGREGVYQDESSKTMYQKFVGILPTSGQSAAFLNTVTLAGVMYALKLIRDEESVIDKILLAVSGNSTA